LNVLAHANAYFTRQKTENYEGDRLTLKRVRHRNKEGIRFAGSRPLIRGAGAT